MNKIYEETLRGRKKTKQNWSLPRAFNRLCLLAIAIKITLKTQVH